MKIKPFIEPQTGIELDWVPAGSFEMGNFLEGDHANVTLDVFFIVPWGVKKGTALMVQKMWAYVF